MTSLRLSFLLFMSTIVCYGCAVDSPDSAKGVEVKFSIASDFTIHQTNTVFIEAEGDLTDYTLMVNGTGFEADVPFNEEMAVIESIALSYEEPDNYLIGLAILRNGVPYIEEALSWSYSNETPYLPIISLSEKASNDDDVDLFIAARLKIETKEIWIEGDYVDGSLGKWYEIPDTFSIPLKLSPEDGTKLFFVKTRNSYGIESETRQVSVERKSVGPESCEASVASTTISGNTVKARVSGLDPFELSYEIVGDVRFGHKGSFTKFEDLTVHLDEDAEEPREITVNIWDLAGNACEPIVIEITRDIAYSGNSVELLDTPVWTDTKEQELIVNYESYSDQRVEIRISGGVVEDENTKKWVIFDPFATSIPISLQSPGGQKYIYVDFRVNGIIDDYTHTVSTVFQPFVNYYSSSASVFVPEIANATTSISGCDENYAESAWINGFPCTTTSGTEITATFHFEDGSSLERSTIVD